MTSAKILADSIAPCGARLTTLLCRYPRPIHSEIMTHREMSKNSASSRAIPTATLIERIEADPWVPSYIGANQRGMQAGQELPEAKRREALATWHAAIEASIVFARKMVEIGVHKQVVNRLVEPGMHIEIILSGTSWTNWDGLRNHPDAEPHFQDLARDIIEARSASSPRILEAGEWHMPLVHPEDYGAIEDYVREHEPETRDNSVLLHTRIIAHAVKISVGRCARVSYLTHEGKRDIIEDLRLHDRLIVQNPLHATPAEHAAMALDWPAWFKRQADTAGLTPEVVLTRNVGDMRAFGRQERPPIKVMEDLLVTAQLRSGNFMGFQQYRKTLPNEYIGGLRP